MLSCLLAWPAVAVPETPSEAVYELVLARLLADEGRGREASESFVAAIELAP